MLFERFGIQPETLGTEFIEITDKVTGDVRKSCNDPISFQWISPMALAVNIAVGWVGCVIATRFTGSATTSRDSTGQ
jgi:hypothetical protein